MPSFTFVHAADLHLGAPFKGLSREIDENSISGKKLLPLLQQATFLALERLVRLCLETQTDFLLLAGDVYNSAEGSLRTHLHLKDAFLTLKKHRIKVFIAHGNHDPLGATCVAWPDNVHVFGPDVSTIPILRERVPLALLHGVSHVAEAEQRNLALLFQREKNAVFAPDLPQLGILHCAVSGTGGEHARYAPCSPADLQAANLDYWALGHVHRRQGLYYPGGKKEGLYAAYPGSLQGLHFNEPGLHGCWLLRCKGQRLLHPFFCPLAPLVWEQRHLDVGQIYDQEEDEIEEFDAISSLEQAIMLDLQQARQALFADAEEHALALGISFLPEYIIIRLHLIGRTSLHAALSRPDIQEELLNHLNCQLERQNMYIFDFKIQTSPLLEMDQLRLQDGLLGETCRLVDELAADKEQLGAEYGQLHDLLYKKNKALLRHLPSLPADEQRLLLEQAHLLCLSMLGDE